MMFLLSYSAPEIDVETILVFSAVTLGIWHAYLIVYNIFFHPLRKVPGPFLAAISPFWLLRCMQRRRTYTDIDQLHKTYGPVVRIAPNELSFATIRAQIRIYGSPNNPETYFTKAGTSEEVLENTAFAGTNIITTHNMILYRKLKSGIGRIFSEKGLAEQEPIAQQHFRELLKSIDAAAESPDAVINIGEHISQCVWRMSSDLAFGECLTEEGRITFDFFTSHAATTLASFGVIKFAVPFVGLLISVVTKLLGFALKYVPFFSPTAGHVISGDRLRNCLGQQHKGRDFMTTIREHSIDTGLHLSDMDVSRNALLLFFAGYGTSSVGITAAVYQLLKNPSAMQKLQAEVRENFNNQDEITGERVAKLPYLNGVIYETLRLLPSANTTFAERASPGIEIDGVYVPAGTVVSSATYTMQRSPDYWHSPLSFAPERWFDNGPGSKYENDDRRAWKPFLSGSRRCMGKPMAQRSLRLALSHLAFRYNLEWVNTDFNWERDVAAGITYEDYKSVLVRVKHKKV